MMEMEKEILDELKGIKAVLDELLKVQKAELERQEKGRQSNGDAEERIKGVFRR